MPQDFYECWQTISEDPVCQAGSTLQSLFMAFPEGRNSLSTVGDDGRLSPGDLDKKCLPSVLVRPKCVGLDEFRGSLFKIQGLIRLHGAVTSEFFAVFAVAKYIGAH